MKRAGLSLLEVILALAILALSMAAIGELIRIGTTSASNAEDYTDGQLLAESKLSEIMSGVSTADPVTRVPFTTNPDWYYTVELAQTEDTEVMALRVTVEKYIERSRPVAFSLIRWIPDPGIELPEEEEEVPADDSNSSQNSGNSSSSGGNDNGSSNGGNSAGGNNGNSGSGTGSGSGGLPNLPGNLPGNLPNGIPGNSGNTTDPRSGRGGQ
jgi:hypothetical protein